MTAATKLMTADEFWNLPDHGGRNELIVGNIVPMSPTNLNHGSITFLLILRTAPSPSTFRAPTP